MLSRTDGVPSFATFSGLIEGTAFQADKRSYLVACACGVSVVLCRLYRPTNQLMPSSLPLLGSVRGRLGSA